MKKQLGVFSGECLIGVCGTETTLIDFKGETLKIGDIVVVKNTEDIEKLAQYFGEYKLQPDYFYSDSKQAGVTG